jgi:hypothetical protein
MDATLFERLLPAAVLLLVWLVVSTRVPPSFWRDSLELLDRLGNELRHGLGRGRWARLPVFSAETIRGKEAEFLRDRLPRKTPRVGMVLALCALLVTGVLVWWYTR